MVNRIIEELQMLTNVVTDDVDYLVSLLLQGGTLDKKDSSSKYEEVQPIEIETVEVDLDDWFNSIGEGFKNDD